MLKLYGAPNSRATRVVWMLEELGLDYAYAYVDLMKGAARRPEYLALNPGGKVPALVDGELILTESAAILTYLGEQHPAAGLVPSAGTPARAHYYQWCFFVLSELEQPLWTMAKHRFALPEAQRVPAMLDTAQWEFAKVTKVLAQGLGEQPFILGEQFSAADILVAHTLSWSRAMKIPPDDPRLVDYAERLLARPALARAKEREQKEREQQAAG